MEVTLKQLWTITGFSPNENQERAITHIDGPLFLTAGPGSGKTRVLLWRTLNLIVFQKVPPERIFLATFTEKAALQLKEGLKAYLGIVTNLNNQPYDLSKMYVGTIHSLCQKLVGDKSLNAEFRRDKPVSLMDELVTYFFYSNRRNWNVLLEAGGYSIERESDAHFNINSYFNVSSQSRYLAITNLMSFFNRLSEEMADEDELLRNAQGEVANFLRMYKRYKELLSTNERYDLCDFSLIQNKAYESVCKSSSAIKHFMYVIIDEYQDTNTIQEKLIFRSCLN